MYSDITNITGATTLIALFSLMWFVMGLVIGRVLPEGMRTKSVVSGGRSGGAPKQARGDGNSRNRRRGAKQDERSGKNSSAELYVGNLPYSLSKKDLAKVFSPYGEVVSVRLIESKSNGKPKGFGFVEMDSQAAASGAAKALNATKINGRAIVVSEAKSRDRRDD